jgi:hypothetical protein
MTKHNQIREHLLSGEPITGLIALELYGVYRLSSNINRLRKNDQIPIKTVMVNSSDGKTVFAKYFVPINERMKK